MATLYIKAYGQYYYDSGLNEMLGAIFFSMPEEFSPGSVPSTLVRFTTGTENPYATPYPLFHDMESAINGLAPINCPTVVSNRNSVLGVSYYTDYDVEWIDPPVLAALSNIDYNTLVNKPTLFSGAYADLSGKPTLFSGAYADLTGKPTLFSGAYADLSGKPTLATVATSGDYNDLSNKPAAVAARSFAQPTRTSGTAFQVSTTRDAQVTYTATAACSAVVLTGSSATMTLQYADNSGMSTNLVTLPGDSFGLPAGLVVSVNGTMRVTGIIPAGKYVRVTTAASAGSPTIGSLVSQEVLI